MATQYSSAYALNAAGTAYIGTSPNPPRKGSTTPFRFTVALAVIANADVIKLCPLPLGARMTRLYVTCTDIDSGTTIVTSLGTTTNVGNFGTSLTIGQAAGTTSVSDATLSASAVFVAGDELLLTATAGPSTTTGTLTVYGEYSQV